MTKEELLYWINNTLRNSRGALDSNKLKNPKYKEYFDSLEEIVTGGETYQQKIWLLENGYTIPPLCSCGKPVKWTRKGYKYSKYCSMKCSGNDSVIKDQRIKTNIEKYEYASPSKNKGIIEKRKQTNIKKYGCTTPFLMKDFKEKAKKTLQDNYGVDNPQKNARIRQKTQQTNIERYGATSPLHGASKSKAQETMLERYGVLYAFQNKKSFQKFKDTMIQLYQTEHALQNEDIKEKEITNRMYKLYNRLKDGNRTQNKVIPLFSFEEYRGTEYEYEWECIECGNKFLDHLQDGHIPRCKVCYPFLTNTSSYELEIVNILKSWDIFNIVTSDRSIIKPYELDIYLPDYRLAIEFHGIYWHSELSGGKGRNYHLNKLRLCKTKGIDLIQIFEDEWLQKKDIITNIIRNRLGLTKTRYFARKLQINKVSVHEQRDFLNNNHIQGYRPCSEAWGLYSGSDLISMATFIRSRHNKNYTWELLRFVSKFNTKVVGGLSKLLSHFNKNHPGESLISYCDKRLFNGKGYLAVGFTQQKDSAPNYYYTTDYRSRKSRIQFQKHKLASLLENFDPLKTEWENMQLNGYDRIWDCGTAVYSNTNTN